MRLYGRDDIRFEEFELPSTGDEEILIKVISDSVCASTYKAIKQGSAHKRVPEDIATNPVIIGHEMCGEIIEVGSACRQEWHPGMKVVIQPALKLDNGHDPGYSYPYIGGNTQYAIVPKLVLDKGCLLPFYGKGYFEGSLAEALGCVLRGYKGFYHTDYTSYTRTDGAKRGGKIAILGGAGPMGIGAVELACGYAGVSMIAVTDLSDERLAFAEKMSPPSAAAAKGVELKYINTSDMECPEEYLLEISGGGFDDVFVMVPVPALFSLAERICREDGCVNFFAGPPVKDMEGSINLYRIHYDGIHVVGTAGSIPLDMTEVLSLMSEGRINAGALVSHILGPNALRDTLFAMEKPNGAKKICYNFLDIPLVAIDSIAELGKSDPMWKRVGELVEKNGGVWCAEAEEYLLAHAPKI